MHNPTYEFVNINAYTKVKFCQFVLKILNGNKIMTDRMRDGRNAGWME